LITTAGIAVGWSVSILGDVALLGAKSSNNDTGSAYVFELANGTWSQVRELTASDGAIDDAYGSSVLVAPNFVLVAARNSDINGREDAGAVYSYSLANVLPVELTSLNALVNGSAVLLEWQTASETNNAGFEVQHKTGEAFTPKGFVEGAGTTVHPQSYRLTVSDLDSGTHTFRLKQIDFDGAWSYSPELTVYINIQASFRLQDPFPNPFSDVAYFSLAVDYSQYIEVGLFNLLGQKQLSIYQGLWEKGHVQVLSLDRSALPSGTYLLHIKGETFSTARFVSLVY